MRLVVEGRTLRKATAKLRVSVSYLSKWATQGIGEINSLDKILKSMKKATHKGPLGQLKSLEDALMRYIFELREQGININTFIAVLRVSFLSIEFRAKTSQRTAAL
jgi:hypothetical protein